MIRDDVRREIEDVLKAQLRPIGYVDAEVLEAVDHDGEPILDIRVHYQKSAGPIDPSPTFSLARLIKDRIRPLGEERFPHFTHLFSDDQQLKVA